MHAWEGRPFDDIASLCARRDPRRYPLGCLTADAEREVLQWFRDARELSAFLWRMEPQRWGLRLGELAEFKQATQEVFVGLDVFGPTDAARLAHNRLSEPRFAIVWWGRFEDLREGRGEVARTLLQEFRAGAPAEALEENELDGFIAWLRSRYGSPSAAPSPE